MGSKKKVANNTPGKAGISHNIKKVMKNKPRNRQSTLKQSVISKFLNQERGNSKPNDNINESRRVLSEVKSNSNKSSANALQSVSVKKDLDMEEGLCEYEKIRLNNIREREALFAELAINEAKAEFKSEDKPKPVVKKGKVAKENTEPARKSLRLAGGKVPEIKRFTYNSLGEEVELDEELMNRPRRSLPRSDYLEATRTFTGATERPDGLEEVGEERFKILQVPKRCTIKQFVLSNNLEFKCGRGFYEFTKPEIISHRKEVVLVEKSSGKMFTGRDACRMIGAGSGIRIPPTTFNTWRVFVQSTSYGRVLVGNTGFLYEV